MSITSTVELDISSALASVDTIGESLLGAVEAFSNELTAALEAAASTEVSVSGDTSDLSAAIEEVSTEPQIIEVDGDAAGVTDSIDAALDSSEGVVSVDGDTSDLVAAIEEAAADTTATITVEADTAAAETALGDLETQAQSTGSSLAGESGSLGAAVGSLSALQGIAAGSSASLATKLGEISPKAAGGIGAVVGLGLAVGQMATDAISAQGAIESFNLSTGEFADELRQVDILGFNTSLDDLATTLGSDDEALLTATKSIFQLGQSSGAAGEEAVKTSQSIALLAANAVALNPELGDVATVTEGLTRALARGGRALVPYKISLSSAEVEARALKDTGKATVGELTQFEKITAASAVALDDFGASIKTNVEAGAKNAQITLNRLREEVTDTVEELGAPLIIPFLDLIEASQPLITGASGAIAALGQAILPIATALLQGLGEPLVKVFSAIADLSPALMELSGVVVDALGPLLDIVGALVPLITPFAVGLGETIKAVASLLDVLGPLPALLLAAYLAFKVFSAALLANPIFLIAAAIVGLVGVIKQHNEELEPAVINQEQFRSVLFGTAKTAKETRDKIAELDDTFGDYLSTSSEFSKLGLVDDLLKVGLSAEAIEQQISSGAQGLEDFTAAGIKAGSVKLKIDGVEQTADQILALDGNLSAYLATRRAEITVGENLVSAANNEIFVREQASAAQLNALVLTGQLSQAQRDEAVAIANSTGHTRSYAEALEIATGAQVAATEQMALTTTATNDGGFALEGNTSAWVALTQAVAQGTLDLSNADVVAKQLGIDAETLKGFINEAETAISTFVDTAVAKIPNAGSVFNDLKDVTDPSTLAFNFRTATDSALDFADNLIEIGDSGFPEVERFLAEQGPKAGAAFASTFLASSEAVKKEFRDSLIANEAAIASIAELFRSRVGVSVDAATDFAEQTTDALGMNLNFEDVTEESIQAAIDLFKGPASLEFNTEAEISGLAVGESLADGLVAGMFKGFPRIEAAAREAIKRAEAAANQEAGIKSPSTLFAEMGDNLGEGLALGFSRAASQVIAEAERILSDAASVTASQPFTVDLASGGATTNTSNMTINVHVTAQPGATAADIEATRNAARDGANAAILANLGAEIQGA